MVYVIVLNWNGWRDTIACLESLLKSTFQDFRIILCDNGSSDHSVEHIEEWARGAILAECSNQNLVSLITPPSDKPTSLSRLSSDADEKAIATSERLIMVQTGQNLGFAGGINVGLRIALQDANMRYVWILNNDTLVDPKALQELVLRLERRPSAGVCGSKLLFFSNPGVVQALGGSEFNPWLARGRHLGGGNPVGTTELDPTEVERRLDYIVGASMLVTRAFLESAGLLSEDYFLYFEEIDWILRSRSKTALAYAPNSIVYHKEGASTGTSVLRSQSNPLSDFYATRNRLIVTRKYFPLGIATTTAVVLLKALLSAAFGKWTNSSAIFKGLARGLSFRLHGSSPGRKADKPARIF